MTINLSDFYGKADNLPTSGTISFSMFYGQSAIDYDLLTEDGNVLATEAGDQLNAEH